MQLFPTGATSDLGAGKQLLAPVRGNGSKSSITTTTASGNNIPATLTAGGTAMVHVYRVGAGTSITGNATGTARAKESVATVNGQIAVKVDRYDSTFTFVSNVLPQTTMGGSTELTTTDAAQALASTACTTTTFNAGDYIVVTFLMVKNAAQTMGAGTITITYNGPSGAAGDTSITLPGTITPYTGLIQTASTSIAGLTTGTTIPVAFAGNPVTGDLLIFAFSYSSAGNANLLSGVASTAGDVWTEHPNSPKIDTTNNAVEHFFYCDTPHGGAVGGADTVTATLSGTTDFRMAIVAEYGPGWAFDGGNGNFATGTATTDGATSGSATTTAAGDLIIGAVLDTVDTSATTTMQSGTNFTARAVSAGSGNAVINLEDYLQASAASIAATFSPNAAHQYLAFLATFKSQTTQTGSVPLAVATALAVAPRATYQPAIAMAVGVSLGVIGQAQLNAAAALGVATAFAVTPSREADAVAALSVATTLAVNPQATYQPTVNIAVATALAVGGIRSTAGAVALAVATALAVTPLAERDAVTAIAIATALAVTASREADAAVPLAVAAVLAVTAVPTYNAAAALAVATALVVTAQSTYQPIVTLAVQTALSAASQSSVGATASLAIATALAITAQAERDAAVQLAVQISLAATPSGAQTGTAPVAVSTALNVTPNVDHDAQVALAITTALAIVPLRTTTGSVPLAIATALTVSPRREADATLALAVQFGLTVGARTQFGATVPLAVQLVLAVIGGVSGAGENIVFHAVLAAQIPRYGSTLTGRRYTATVDAQTARYTAELDGQPPRYAAVVGDRRYAATLEDQP